MLDGRTITFCGEETFKSEKFREMYRTVLTDIKNLNKARKVTWNDTQGKTGASAIKQIFSNIKHNIRAAWIGKKGELKASEKLKADIKRFGEELFKEDFDGNNIDKDFFKDCKNFYGELKGERPGGYAGTKEKLMELIGDKDTDGSLKEDVETFLKESINEKGEFFRVNDLAQRFRSVSSGDHLKAEQFENLLKTYEANSDEGKLKTEIENLFKKEWLDEVCEQKCRDIDAKRDELMARIEDFFTPAQNQVEKEKSAEKCQLKEAKAKENECKDLMNQVLRMKSVPKHVKDMTKKRGLKGIQGIYPGKKTETIKEETIPENIKLYKEKTFDGVGKQMDFGDYQTNFVFDDEKGGTSGNIREMAIKRLKEDFKNVFPNGDGDKFESLLKTNDPKKNDTISRLKTLVTDAAKAQKENVENRKPTSEAVAQKNKFLENLPFYLNTRYYEDPMDTRGIRVMKYFNETLQGSEKTREKLKSLLDARKEESDFSIFNRLEQMLETIMPKDDGFEILEEEQKETLQETVDPKVNPSLYV